MELIIRLEGSNTPLTPTEASGLAIGSRLEVVVGSRVVNVITVHAVSRGPQWTPNLPPPP